MAKLTDKFIRDLKPRPHKTKPGAFVPYRVYDDAVPGLHIQVSKGGRKNWTLAYQWYESRKFLKLGTYPATNLMDARKRAMKLQGKIEAGENPIKTVQPKVLTS